MKNLVLNFYHFVYRQDAISSLHVFRDDQLKKSNLAQE